MEIREQFIEVEGLRIHYYSAGEAGSPVVLFHGTGLDSAHLSWGAIIGPLAEAGHRVFAADMPGYGDSEIPKAPYRWDGLIAFAGHLLDALGLQRASLMGLSMGGGIALGVALRRPERVDKLVLVDSYGLQRTVRMQKLSYITVKIPGLLERSYAMVRGNRGLVRSMLGSLVHDAHQVPEALIDDILAEAAKPNAGRAAAALQRSDVLWNGVRTVYMDRLSEIHAPTLFIHGRDDQLVPLHWAEEAHARLPGSQLHVIDNAGHWPQAEKAGEVAEVAARFLA